MNPSPLPALLLGAVLAPSLAVADAATRATVTTTVKRSASPLLPTGPFSRSEASMDIDPVVGFLGVGYRF